MTMFTGAYIENEYGVMTISSSERLETYRRRLKDLENRIQKTKDTTVFERMTSLKEHYRKEIRALEEFMAN